MIILLAFAGVSMLLASVALNKNRRIFEASTNYSGITILFAVIPTLAVGLYLVGLRPLNAGGDTYYYLRAFSYIHNPFSAQLDANYGSELLFWPTQAVLKYFVSDRGWLVLNSMIVATLSFFAYRRLLRNYSITPLIFSFIFLTYFCVYAGNAMRQIYAVPLIVIALSFLYDKDLKRYMLFTLLAVGYHWSAVILLAAPFFYLIPNERKYYICVPVVSVCLSQLLQPTIYYINSLFGFSWLAFKSDLYIYGARESHIDQVWYTLNFWLCVSVFILCVALGFHKQMPRVSKIILFFFSLILFSINSADVSERYMVLILFLLPVLIAYIIKGLRFSAITQSFIYVATFVFMSFLVFTRPSAIITLGL
ncbi:EpsG family protein [Idiomarina abyssalis]|uniref:EpsG family protein n=1 Tax=Idiomarina abyssalis TaxID=86102 RepID=UPI003A93D431